MTPVSSLGRAANADAGIDRSTCTVIDWPAGTVTSAGDAVTTAPRCDPFVATLR